MATVPGEARRLPPFETCLADAIANSGPLVQRTVGYAREALAKLQAGNGLQGARAVAVPEALHLLGKHADFLIVRFPQALQDAVDDLEDEEGAPPAEPKELALADEGQLDDRVELTRSRQTTLRTVAVPLAEFTSLVCAARGMTAVRSDANPLVPDTYIRALQALVDRTDTSKVARVLWMQQLSAGLGSALADEYTRLSALLRAAGVAPAAYNVPTAEPEATPAARPYAPPAEASEAAQRIAAEVAAWPEFDRVPPLVRDFVCGPWAEVVAKARANAGAGPIDPGSAYALVRPLFWSAQPELGRSDVKRLMVMVPSLVSRLRTGLKIIDYPQDRTDAFFKSLSELHGIAARAPGSSFAMRSAARAGGAGGTAPGEVARTGSGSGAEAMPDHTLNVSASALEVLYIGVWVESFSGKGWKRMQLNWISPKRALMLFTADDGSTESMSRRGCLRRMRDGQLRIVPDLDLDDVFG